MSGSLTPTVTLGANFQGLDDVSTNLGSIPDTDGAVGPGTFVEFINGAFAVYDQSGNLLQFMTSDAFWTAAGVTPIIPLATFDPRILFDPVSGRWFATSAEPDSQEPPGYVLLAVSKTSDPTQGWTAFSLPASPDGSGWPDFPTLGINRDGVFISANSIGFFHQIVITVPKADLLQAAPTVANATFFFSPGETSLNVQPTVAYQSSGSEAIAEIMDNNYRSTSVDGPITSPTLNTTGRDFVLPSGFPSGNPPPAQQPGGAIFIRVGDQFPSSVVLQNGNLFAVRTVNDGGRAAVQWFEIGDPLGSPTVLGSGIIQPPGLDAYNPSIAVNALGEAVIGFTASGPTEFASAYAVAGTLDGNTIDFGSPILLRQGEGTFADPQVPTPAWGDYSATTFDPANPTHFWTIQELAGSPSGPTNLNWIDQISEIVFPAQGPTAQTWFGGAGDFENANDWSPPGAPDGTPTLIINAGRVTANALTITNPTIQLGSPSAVATLVLKDSTLSAANSVRVQRTTFDTSEAEIHARIRVEGSVTDNGAFDVGATGIDVNQLAQAHLAVNIARDSSFTLGSTGIWFANDDSTIDVKARGHDAQFVNDGTIKAVGGAVTMNVPVSGVGTFAVSTNNDSLDPGRLEFAEEVSRDETVDLQSGLLKLDQPMTFLGAIRGFDQTSTIELSDTTVTSERFRHNKLFLFDGKELIAKLNIIGDFAAPQFVVENRHGNAFISLNPLPAAKTDLMVEADPSRAVLAATHSV